MPPTRQIYALCFVKQNNRHQLFEEHEDLLNLFSKLGELRTKEQQQSSLELAEHATKVMGTLDEAIRALDSLDSLIAYLEAVGASHRRIPTFERNHFHVS
ncbi:hypothetical protein B566_EDAN001910 [Ephemera danica]|nr:hypothetical protein B566_EDAN001910 [Ephemera danica]